MAREAVAALEKGRPLPMMPTCTEPEYQRGNFIDYLAFLTADGGSNLDTAELIFFCKVVSEDFPTLRGKETKKIFNPFCKVAIDAYEALGAQEGMTHPVALRTVMVEFWGFEEEK